MYGSTRKCDYCSIVNSCEKYQSGLRMMIVVIENCSRKNKHWLYWWCIDNGVNCKHRFIMSCLNLLTYLYRYLKLLTLVGVWIWHLYSFNVFLMRLLLKCYCWCFNFLFVGVIHVIYVCLRIEMKFWNILLK